MQFKKTTLSWLIFIIPAFSLAQSSNLPQGAKESWLLNRMDIKLMNDTALGFSTAKPITGGNPWLVSPRSHCLTSEHAITHDSLR